MNSTPRLSVADALLEYLVEAGYKIGYSREYGFWHISHPKAGYLGIIILYDHKVQVNTILVDYCDPQLLEKVERNLTLGVVCMEDGHCIGLEDCLE